MLNTTLPLPRAFYLLRDVAHKHGLAYADTEVLIWLAIARLYAFDKTLFSKSFSLDDLASEAGWAECVSIGLDPQAVLLSRERQSFAHWDPASVRQAIAVIKDLSRELEGAPDSAWDVLPFLFSTERKMMRGLEEFMAQSVAELMVDMLKDASGSVWAPFDTSGQIAITAFRRGYVVQTASITGYESLTRQLLICIETGSFTHPRLITETPRDTRGRPMVRADFIIANPPLGRSVREDQWGQWQVDTGDKTATFDRSEAWTVHHLMARADKQMIVLSSQGWLFAQGQEKRLREALIEKPDVSLQSVVTLPAGAISSSNVMVAFASLVRGEKTHTVKMTDIKGENRIDSLEVLIESFRPVVMGEQESPKYSRLVTAEEIRSAEYVLLPQRLIRSIELSGVHALPLGELCDTVRPPTPFRGLEGDDVHELGIPNIRDGDWSPIEEPEKEKRILVSPATRPDVFLTRDDILLSVKGSLGFARLISDFYQAPQVEGGSEWNRAVVSSSCVALRLHKGAAIKGITPQYILMYLRSAEGQEQLRSLQVGAAMPHISIQTLLSAFRIPIPTPEEHDAVVGDYEKLCSIEHQIKQLTLNMTSIVQSRWIVNSD
jgi:type I restriction-modification system DNA methylase subunit